MASKEKKRRERADSKADSSDISEIMHRLKTHPFLFIGTVVVLVIVIVAFVLVPAIVPGEGIRSGGDLIFGYYNKTPIKYVANNYFYQVQQTLYQRQRPNPEESNYLGAIGSIWRQAFEEAAVRIGILDEMKQAGFIAPENVVDREIARLSMFQENGRFSSARYRALDNSSRMNLWQQVQESYIVQTYISDMENLLSSSNEASFIAAMASPQRNFDLAIFPLSSYPDSEVAAYAESHPELFSVANLSRITITSSEREARQVLDSIKNGSTTFEEAARNYSQDWAADRGGEMGMTMAYELQYDITDGKAIADVMNLGRGEVSELVKAASGWSIYRVNETVRRVDLSDSSQNTRIRNYLMSFMRGIPEDWMISKAEKFSEQVRANGFDAAIADAGLTKNSFGPIPLNYGNSALMGSVRSSGIPELENAGDNQFFWKAAFSTPLNSPSSPLVIGDNIIVLYPLEEMPAEENEIELIKSYYSYWISLAIEDSFRLYFLTNKKMDDRFFETFYSLWMEN
jgi:peptidyl-prolyl cis-trans isomerase D